MPNLQQNSDGSLDLDGQDHSSAGFLKESFVWTPSTVDSPFFVAARTMRVKAINARVEVAGTDASAVTAVIRKVASGTALTSGTALHSGSINLKGTAATNQALTLSTTDSDLTIPAGTALAFDITGVMTAAVGCVTVSMTPA